jgi:hypothetical protein
VRFRRANRVTVCDNVTVTMSDAERQRNFRERKRMAALHTVRDHGPVRAGVESTIECLDDPDPALVALARSLANLQDDHPSAAVAGELRKLIGDLKQGDAPRKPASGQPSKLALLRAEHARDRRRHSGA